MPRRIVVVLASEPQEAVLCAALTAHGVTVTSVPPSAHLETATMQAMRDAQPPLLLIDIAVLAQLATGAAQFCEWKRRHCASAELLLFCSGLYAVHEQARAWAQRLGARDLLPGGDLAHRRESLLPAINTILSVAGAGAADDTAIERALRALPAMLDNTTLVAHAWRQIDTLRALGPGLEPGVLIAKMRGCSGVEICARLYRMKTYDECFVGNEAVDWLTQTMGIARADAVCVGQALLELGHLYHVAREQPFQDGHFFYRLFADTPRLNALDLCALSERMREGVRIRDRKFHGVTYPACFVGADAAAWMREVLELSENEVMTLGQRLMDLFIVHHVVDGQPFRDGKFFYRFHQDEH